MMMMMKMMNKWKYSLSSYLFVGDEQRAKPDHIFQQPNPVDSTHRDQET